MKPHEPLRGRVSAPGMPTTGRELLARLATVAIPLTVYLLGFRYVGSGDTRPAELLPIALLRGQGFDLSRLIDPAEKYPYWYHRVGDRLVSSYPVLPGLLNTPVFMVAHLAGVDVYEQRLKLSMISSSLITSVSVLFMYLCLERLCARRRSAFGLAMIYAFGTCAWSVASRGMWQHGPSLLFLSAALALLVREGPRAAAWSGLFLGLAVVDRPPTLALVAPLVVFVLLRHKEARLRFAALAAVPLLLHAVYAAEYLGSPFALGYWNAYPEVSNFRGNPLVGLPGLLVSPSRGLFVFSPIYLFALPGMAISLRDRRRWPIAPYLLAGAILLVLLYSRWSMWWGGHTFGYRYLIETLPGLTIFLAIAWEERIAASPALRSAFALSVVWSFGVHALGAYLQPSGFNQKMDENPSVLWSVRTSEIVMSTRKAFSAFGWERR
jgi:hypothetical protein